MAEQDANSSSNVINNQNKIDEVNVSTLENEELSTALGDEIKENETEPIESDPYLPSYESPAKKEENPFSFKKFLNQDTSAQKNKGARKKVYTTASISSNKSNASEPSPSRSQSNLNPRVMGNSEVSSVLPDFVQDHLVIEQCYLNGSSTINIDNLSLQNLPDLNLPLDHQKIHYSLDSKRDNNHLESALNQFSTNLPDFTLGVRNHESVTHKPNNNDRLPDFALNTGKNIDSNKDNNGSYTNEGTRRNNANEIVEPSHSNRQRAQISSSPSVPPDLPSYEHTNKSNPDISIPFDLPIPAEDNSCGSRCNVAPETVTKSLPDFLSDGPIKKELDDNLKNIRGNTPNTVPNGLLYQETPAIRLEHERLIREIGMLRCQLADKTRRIEILESELEHLHTTDQREAASLEYAFKEVENNLKQTTKRALKAEDLVFNLKQENKLLKSEVCSLRAENVELKLGKFESNNYGLQDTKNQKIAKELRTAANLAENSLRSLLSGIENLRIIASSMENVNKFQENSEDYEGFLQEEDSASGPVL